MVNVSPSSTTTRHHQRAGIRWGRVLVAALLLELALFVVLVPIMLIFGAPFTPGAGDGDFTVFFVSVPVGCFVLAFGAGRWVARGVSNRPALHGLLVGTVATLMYLALGAAQPGGLATIVAGYGVVMFLTANAARIAGATVGAATTRLPSP